jgi:GntR family transcriptional regulator, transcriptional repressor for pyruvate dehydrogenase complex
MKFTKIPKIQQLPKLSDQVSDFLISEIEKGAFRPGELLPSEAELSKLFNVSRTVIREALGRLKYDGLLESSRGSKSKVAADSAKRAFRMNRLDDKSLIEIGYLYEFRAILESEAAALAANRRTEDDLKNMKSLIEAMNKACQDAYDATSENVKFHKAVTKASKNPFLSDFMNFLGDKIIDLVQADRDFSQHVGLPLEVQNEHIILFEAISQQKPDKARKAVLMHLKNAVERRGATIFQ